jgi:hypothetical protein
VSFARWQPYYTDRELELDRRIHAFGLLLALIATPLLLGLAAESKRPGLVLPCAIYLLSLLGMLGSSTLFRHTPLRWSKYRWFLRRLDHAAIFLFIAGTYTPFTVGQMHDERVGPTVAVWAGALIGAAYKRIPGRLAAAVAGRLRGARLVCAVRAAADASVHGAAGSGADSRRRCALYGRRGDSSPTDAVSHANLAWFCDCRRRLPLRRGP